MAVALRDKRTDEVTKHLVALVGEEEKTDVLLFPSRINTLGIRSAGTGLKRDILESAGYVKPAEAPSAVEESDDGQL